jgi:hypothetical protein
MLSGLFSIRMTVLKSKSINWRLIVWLAIGIVTIAGVYLRFADMTADPPSYFAGHGQSLTTDPHHYGFFARNKILFDQWELFDASKWRVFEVTIMSGFSYVLFLIFGISLYTANLAGVIISLLSILIFLLAFRKIINKNGILLALFLLMFNKILLVYGKLPYTENGMILIISFLFFVFVNYRQNLWGKIGLGFLIALSGLTGKIFGFLMILPVLLSILYEAKPGRYKDILIVTASCAVTTILWISFVYGRDLDLLFGYFTAQTVGQYGLPGALKSPITFFEKLISFGNDTRFYFNAPAAGLAGFIAFLYILLSYSKDYFKQHIPVVFLIIWFVAGQFFFMPENYRPLRYVYMLYFPLAGLIAFIFSKDIFANYENIGKRNYPYLIILFFLLWILFEQLVFNIFYDNSFKPLHQRLVWFSAPVAIIVTLIEMRFKFLRIIFQRYFKMIAIVFIIVLTLWNFGTDYSKWQEQKSFNITETGRDIDEVLGEDAIICGPIIPTLLLENNLKGIIYGSGITDQDTGFFSRYPATHIIVEEISSGDIVEKFTGLDSTRLVTAYWIRDFRYILARISDLTGNSRAAAYQLTDFEIGRIFMEKKIYDSAFYYLERFRKKYPDNKSVLLALGEIYPINAQVAKAELVYQKAVSLYPRDFSVLLAQGIYYQARYTISGDRQFLNLANRIYQQVLTMNPHHADRIMEIASKIAKH